MSILEQLEREFGPLPPDYVGPIGVRTFCANCPTDEAFERLAWAVQHICAKSTWRWFAERLALLEREFSGAGMSIAVFAPDLDGDSLDAILGPSRMRRRNRHADPDTLSTPPAALRSSKATVESR